MISDNSTYNSETQQIISNLVLDFTEVGNHALAWSGPFLVDINDWREKDSMIKNDVGLYLQTLKFESSFVHIYTLNTD